MRRPFFQGEGAGPAVLLGDRTSVQSCAVSILHPLLIVTVLGISEIELVLGVLFMYFPAGPTPSIAWRLLSSMWVFFFSIISQQLFPLCPVRLAVIPSLYPAVSLTVGSFLASAWRDPPGAAGTTPHEVSPPFYAI